MGHAVLPATRQRWHFRPFSVYCVQVLSHTAVCWRVYLGRRHHKMAGIYLSADVLFSYLFTLMLCNKVMWLLIVMSPACHYFVLSASRSDSRLVSQLENWSTNSKKGSSYSISECRVPELIPVLGSRPAGDVSHKPGCRLSLLSARPAVTPATLKRAATSFAAWWTQAQWVWTVCLRLLSDSITTAIWTRALLRLNPAC